MWMPQLLPALPAPDEHAGSAPVSEYANLCVVPDVLIGDTEPATARLPAVYEKYGTNALALSVADTPSDSSEHAMREPSYA